MSVAGGVRAPAVRRDRDERRADGRGRAPVHLEFDQWNALDGNFPLRRPRIRAVATALLPGRPRLRRGDASLDDAIEAMAGLTRRVHGSAIVLIGRGASSVAGPLDHVPRRLGERRLRDQHRAVFEREVLLYTGDSRLELDGSLSTACVRTSRSPSSTPTLVELPEIAVGPATLERTSRPELTPLSSLAHEVAALRGAAHARGANAADGDVRPASGRSARRELRGVATAGHKRARCCTARSEVSRAGTRARTLGTPARRKGSSSSTPDGGLSHSARRRARAARLALRFRARGAARCASRRAGRAKRRSCASARAGHERARPGCDRDLLLPPARATVEEEPVPVADTLLLEPTFEDWRAIEKTDVADQMLGAAMAERFGLAMAGERPPLCLATHLEAGRTDATCIR